jgi:hypothetical protein
MSVSAASGAGTGGGNLTGIESALIHTFRRFPSATVRVFDARFAISYVDPVTGKNLCLSVHMVGNVGCVRLPGDPPGRGHVHITGSWVDCWPPVPISNDPTGNCVGGGLVWGAQGAFQGTIRHDAFEYISEEVNIVDCEPARNLTPFNVAIRIREKSNCDDSGPGLEPPQLFAISDRPFTMQFTPTLNEDCAPPLDDPNYPWLLMDENDNAIGPPSTDGGNIGGIINNINSTNPCCIGGFLDGDDVPGPDPGPPVVPPDRVLTPCCPVESATVSKTLTVVADTMGVCPALEFSIGIAYSNALRAWVGTAISGGNFITVIFWCEPGGTWFMNVYCAGILIWAASGAMFTGNSCPVDMTAGPNTSDTSPCCASGVPLIIRVFDPTIEP